MSEPIANLLRQMLDEFEVTTSFIGNNEVLPVNEFDMVMLNTAGDLDTVTAFMDSQPVFLADNAPVLVPVVPASCFVEADEWVIKGARKPMCKPFSQTRISDLIYSQSNAVEQAATESSAMIGSEGRPLRVLICEDVPVNQMFAKEICSKAGIDYVVRDNGRQGVETLLQDTRFDVIFMDCHMPIMDGFEAVGMIRQMSEQGLIPEIPVVALTANALAGDREKCLAAGMDDYLAKPFEFNEFLEKVHVHAKLSAADESHQGMNEHVEDVKTDVPAFDFECLVDRVGDRSFAISVAEQFAASLPQYVMDLQNCLDEQDPQTTHAVAHSLKGSASMVGATRISNIAAEIESMAQSDQLQQNEIQFAEILSEFNEFVEALQRESLAAV
jgi:CheY-like chemotaxis protein